MTQGPADLAIIMHDLRGGGAERVTITLAAAIAARGYRVQLVLFQRKGDYPPPAGVEIVDLAARRVVSGVPALARYLKSARPRAVLSVMTHVNIAAIAAARLAGFKGRLLVVEHNTMSQKIASARRAAARLTYRLVPLVYRFSDKVANVSRAASKDLVEVSGLPQDKVITLYNPVVRPDLAALAAEPVDHPWLAAGEPPVLLSVGRLTAQKDFANLIRAFAMVREARAARLVILGEGEDRAALEALAQELCVADDVALPGFVANPYAYMARAGVFVLSSRWEGLPTVLIEAMACGAPVVSTDCPSGPHEILDGGRLGRLVPMQDASALAAAVLDALDAPMPDTADWVGQFSVDAATDRYVEALGLAEKN